MAFGLHESQYVSQKALSNLKLYKYASVDKSPVTYYVLRHYWNWAVELFPLWMAPNLITLCGLLLIIINMICVMIWTPDLVGPTSSWLYYSYAIGLWLYSTFDNVDGKQARRTKTSSPLGELFDHGCDALNCSFGAVVQAAAMGLGHSWYAAFLLLLTTLPFYLSTWEEYHTGVLYLGYINGPTEGLILACCTMVISGMYGPHVWHQSLGTLFGSLVPSSICDTSLLDMMVLGMSCLLVFIHSPACFWAVYKVCRSKGKSFFATAIIQNIPIFVYCASGYLWLASPYSWIFKHQHFILFALTTGIVFGRMATKIILAHVTKMPFPMFTTQLVPLVVGAILVNLPVWFNIDPILNPTTEHYYLWAYFLFCVVAYLNWAQLVINKFCNYLGINCLTIPYQAPKVSKIQKETASIKPPSFNRVFWRGAGEKTH